MEYRPDFIHRHPWISGIVLAVCFTGGIDLVCSVLVWLKS